MVKLKLICALLGEAGSVFGVEIDDGEQVWSLKEAIAAALRYEGRPYLLKLFLTKPKDGAWLRSDDPDVISMRSGAIPEQVRKLLNEEIDPAEGIGDLFGGAPTKKKVHVLVGVPVNCTKIFCPPLRPIAEGLNVEMPHLSRNLLVSDVFGAVMDYLFVLFSSPAGSGKTSLLALFASQYPGFRYVPIAFDSTTADATTILLNHGIDIRAKKCSVPEDKRCIFMLDDCQRQYHDVAFWTGLIKGAANWIPNHVRFIISATHLLETDAENSPVAFKSLPRKFTRDDFLVSDEEARELLEMENGLPARLRFPTFMEVIVRGCNGHVGSLRVSMNTIHTHFLKKTLVEEHHLLEYYMSGEFVEQMARCFGSDHRTPSDPNHQTFLAMCLVNDPACRPVVSKLTHDEEQCFTRLKKAGIVFDDAKSRVKFTSPLAERYYCKWLFPGRGFENPTSLDDLVRKAIGSMSASMLKQSVALKYDFPKEAVFQHQFMAALALHTMSTCYICPELSRTFPASPGQRSQRIAGEIDFYLNGSLRWGIELLVNGVKIGEHMSRFAKGGKYAALAAKEHVVVDFRGNESGSPTNVLRKERRVTAFFKLADFSSCECIFGSAAGSEHIILKH